MEAVTLPGRERSRDLWWDGSVSDEQLCFPPAMVPPEIDTHVGHKREWKMPLLDAGDSL